MSASACQRVSVARCIALTRAPTRVLPQAQEKQAKAAEAAGAKAAKELAEKAKKVDDKRPLSFDEMLANSVKQQEAELGMSMSEEEVAEMAGKLRKLLGLPPEA